MRQKPGRDDLERCVKVGRDGGPVGGSRDRGQHMLVKAGKQSRQAEKLTELLVSSKQVGWYVVVDKRV